MAITLNGTTGITTPSITSDAGLTADGISFADGTPANTLVTTTGGNVGIGTSSPTPYNSGAKVLQVNSGVANCEFKLTNSTTGNSASVGLNLIQSGNDTYVWNGSNSFMAFGTNNAERMRIDSSGQAMIGTTTVSDNARLSLVSNSTSANYITYGTTGNTSGNGHYVYLTGSRSASSTTYAFIYGDDSSNRFWVAGNGGISNFQANNVNISDRNVKKDFSPSKPYLETICSIPVQTFKYIDQGDDNELTLGVVAQDVQAVAPELVTETNWGTEENPQMRLSIYQTDLQYALMKCIQEQQAIITDLKARIETLENK